MWQLWCDVEVLTLCLQKDSRYVAASADCLKLKTGYLGAWNTYTLLVKLHRYKGSFTVGGLLDYQRLTKLHLQDYSRPIQPSLNVTLFAFLVLLFVRISRGVLSFSLTPIQSCLPYFSEYPAYRCNHQDWRAKRYRPWRCSYILEHQPELQHNSKDSLLIMKSASA